MAPNVPMVEAFASHPLVARETASYDAKCLCTQRIEAGREVLHRSLERVLIVDMRFTWNGIGNSLTRWLAVLRFGTAAGYATFLWMSDRDHVRPPSARDGGKRAGGRRLSAALPRASKKWRRAHLATRPSGFDLGDYFVAVGADWRWSHAAHRRVSAAMRARNVSSPTLVRYSCGRHTWGCMRPELEWGPLGEPHPGYGPLSGGFAREPSRMSAAHESERDGALLSWFASSSEPWLLLRLREQTALEQSASAAGAVLSGAWLSRPTPLFRAPMPRSPTSTACGECMRRPKRLKTAGCVADRLGAHGFFRASVPPPKDRGAEDAALWKAAVKGEPPHAPWVGPMRWLRALEGNHAFSIPCAAYAVLRPRPWVQRAMLPYIERLGRAGAPPFVALHMRTGFADWQFYSYGGRGRGGTGRGRGAAERAGAPDGENAPNPYWSRAASAARASPKPYADHFASFEKFLRDCTELSDAERSVATPCFNWKRPFQGASPRADAARLCGSGGGRETRTPSNGTLAAVLRCAGSFAQRLESSEKGAGSSRGAGPRVGLLVLGDAPALGSLASSLPAFAGRVVHTNDAGAIAHTTFTGSCSEGGGCLRRVTHDPRGGWTRAMVDFYLGGLADGFVSALFSSFVGAVLRRSLTCCGPHRMHFGAMYSQQYSHRDKPMRNVELLHALMQTVEPRAGEAEWGQSNSSG